MKRLIGRGLHLTARVLLWISDRTATLATRLLFRSWRLMGKLT